MQQGHSLLDTTPHVVRARGSRGATALRHRNAGGLSARHVGKSARLTRPKPFLLAAREGRSPSLLLPEE